MTTIIMARRDPGRDERNDPSDHDLVDHRGVLI